MHASGLGFGPPPDEQSDDVERAAGHTAIGGKIAAAVVAVLVMEGIEGVDAFYPETEQDEDACKSGGHTPSVALADKLYRKIDCEARRAVSTSTTQATVAAKAAKAARDGAGAALRSTTRESGATAASTGASEGSRP